MSEQPAFEWAVAPEELDRIPFEKRALGYIRVSDEKGRGEYLISPEIQKHSIQTLAGREDLVVVAWIYDKDKSGRYFTKRRVKDVAQGVRDRQWKNVLLWKWSRWGRNMKESLVYLSHVEDEARGIVRAATEDFDPRTSVGKFSRNQMLLIAELQSDMISDSWKEAQAKRRRDGLPHTGGPRFGYDYDRRTGYTVNEDQMKVLRGGRPLRAAEIHRAAGGVAGVHPG
ncbi:recombinase family protein [Micromonospora chersina]|uniref:recombinase family protein n=1 Tax=Micromonospora chersina TaxID=47854 RepID=UPI00371C02AB